MHMRGHVYGHVRGSTNKRVSGHVQKQVHGDRHIYIFMNMRICMEMDVDLEWLSCSVDGKSKGAGCVRCPGIQHHTDVYSAGTA